MSNLRFQNPQDHFPGPSLAHRIKSSYKDIETYPTIEEYLKRIQTSTYQPLTERNAFFIARLLFSVKAFNNHLSSYFRQKVNRKVRE